MLSFRLLVVEDDRAEQDRIERNMRRMADDCLVLRASDRVSAVNQFRRHRPEVVVLDLSLNSSGPSQGFELLRQFARIDPSTRIIVLTGHTESEIGIEAIKLGAASFLNKPTNMLALETLVRDYAQTAKFRRQAQIRSAETALEGFVGESSIMQDVYRLIRQCAQSDSNVFIVGETGTGKELAANAVHRLSARAGGPFSVYFGSVPSSLADAELFGYVRGAFTGASPRGADGCIKRADRGTLFIDELDSLELAVQRKLLRTIEERTFKPIGSDDYLRSDFRLVSAAQPRIFDLVEKEEFREDLLSRVEVITILLPPLRDRKDDIPKLVEHFEGKARTDLIENGSSCRIQGFSAKALSAFAEYSWPRNVRQLAHVVQHGMIQAHLRGSETVDLEDIMPRLRDVRQSVADGSAQPASGKTLRETVEQFERRILAESLKRNDFTLTAVCQELGVGRTTLWRKLRQYQLVEG